MKDLPEFESSNILAFNGNIYIRYLSLQIAYVAKLYLTLALVTSQPERV